MGETCGMMMQVSSIFCLTKKQICSMIFYRLDSLHCELFISVIYTILYIISSTYKTSDEWLKDQLVYQKDAASIKIEQDI